MRQEWEKKRRVYIALFIPLLPRMGGNNGHRGSGNKVSPLFLPNEYVASLERRPTVWKRKKKKRNDKDGARV